jgi:transposase
MDSHKYSAQVERLELIETGRRRRWSDDEKLRSSGSSWRACRRPGRYLPQQAGFVPALVIPAETPPMVTPAPSSGQMVIIVSKDRRVIVDASVDTAALARVLQVLERG